MMIQLAGNQLPVQYAVIVEGKVLHKASTIGAAESFKETLAEDVRMKAEVVPCTAEGKQVLLG